MNRKMKRSRLKLTKRVKDPPDLRIQQIMDYSEAVKNDTWSGERMAADAILKHCRNLNLPLKLDKLTLGVGNCFMVAVLQQLKTPDVYNSVSDELKQLADELNQMKLRSLVVEFIRQEVDHPKVIQMRETFAPDLQVLNGPNSWEEYWEMMLLDCNWASGEFVQATAWYLDCDIWIMGTSCTRQLPFIKVSGNMSDGESLPTNVHPLLIGQTTGTHFQSLLFDWDMINNGNIEKQHTTMRQYFKGKLESSAELDEPPCKIQKIDKTISNPCDNKCPNCGKVFQQLLRHINQSKCRAFLDQKFIQEVENMSKEKTKLKNKMKIAAFRERKRIADHEEMKKKHKQTVAEYRERKRLEDHEEMKRQQNKTKALSRERKRLLDHETMKRQQKEWNKTMRKIENEDQRLKAFRQAVMYGPIFVCVSCHMKLFRNAVVEFTKNTMKEINEKIPLKDCIVDLNLTTKVLTENHQARTKKNAKEIPDVSSKYICVGCVQKLRVGKLPASSVMNNLHLHDTDEDLKTQDLVLTELEASLIAHTIIFQKIYQLPRSRWTALTDKIINVPISVEAINSTIAQLPRTPDQAGLIGIALKRKMTLKGNHKRQLINPEKMFRMLEKLKKSGNKLYTDVSSPSDFKKRCEETDKVGYKVIYSDNEDDIEEELDPINAEVLSDAVMNEDEDKIPDEEKHEIEEKEKNPVKKHQFVYDESLCMVDKYPEISVAPGEGQRPSSIVTAKDSDVKAFPHLHNADGSNGKDQDRNVKLTNQRYFIQRVLNKETRFAKSPAYLYYCVGLLEEKQIYRNISLVGIRGKKTVTPDGSTTFELNDEFRALESIKNTLTYWRKAKYEILAKLENEGPFQLFFTLSCADLRWHDNFAAILRDKGMTIKYKCGTFNGDWDYIIEVKSNSGNWIPIEQFIKEELEDSKHELVRGNVVTATRIFHQRVKAFLSKIVLCKSNPLSVKFYTYKVEFQERGAGHIHGTLWLDTIKL